MNTTTKAQRTNKRHDAIWEKAKSLATANQDKTAHTPGPWTWSAQGGDPYILHKGQKVAKVYDDGDRDNRQLIAAAPTMLQALKDLTAQIQLGKLNIRRDFSLMNAHAAATKAIFQAEGGS